MNPIQLAHAYAVCRGIARRAAKNFYFSFLVLPKEKRNAICAVYAFMRHADDITDDRSVPLRRASAKARSVAGTMRNAFRRDISATIPYLYALPTRKQRFNIPADLFEQLVAGTAMDLDTRVLTRPVLQPLKIFTATAITWRQSSAWSASTSSDIAMPQGRSSCRATGIAFQLTNIIRDVKEDALMGRIYMPQEDLARFNVPKQRLRPRLTAQQLQTLLEFEAQRARELYAAAD